MSKTYDKAVYDLGATFLSDRPSLDNEIDRVDLAKAIQSAIEEFISERTKLRSLGIDIAFHRDFYTF
jgi:hypothetical protein